MEIDTSSEISGWTALTNVSCFVAHTELKKQLNIFGELDAWLDYLEYLIRVDIHKADESRFRDKKRKKELCQELAQALKSLKNDERIYYYNIMVDLIITLISNKLTAPHIQNTSFLIIESYTRSYNLKIWKQKKLRFDRQNHIIYAQKDKKIKIYDLGNYIVRRSNNTDYFCIVLEAINPAPLEKSKTVHLGFEYKNSYNLWFYSIQNSVKYKLWEKLGEMLGKKALIKEENLSKSTNEGHPQSKSQSFYSEPPIVKKTNLFQTQSKIKQPNESDVSLSIQNSEDTSQYNFTLKMLDQSPLSKDEELTLLKQTFTYRLLNESMKNTLEELHCECQKESEALKMRKKKVNIHRILLQSYKLSQLQNIQHFQQILQPTQQKEQSLGQLHVYQHKSFPLNFKLVYSTLNTSNLSKQSLLHSLLQSKESQSPAISKTEIKCVVLFENITINLEEHTSYNRLYRPRQFVYVRHLAADLSNNVYIIDRSIEQPMIKRRQNFVRAHLFRITKLHITHQHIKITMDFTMRFNGELRIQQEVNHSKKYIDSLQPFLQKICRKQQKNCPLIFYDCQRVISEQQTIDASEDHQTLINISISEFQNDSSLKAELGLRKQSSFYQIPYNFLLNSHINQSLLETGEQSNHIAHFSTQNRNTYSAPRKYYKEYLSPKFSFLQEIHQQTETPTLVVPFWTTEWHVDEQRGGLTQKSCNPKEKKLFKQILQNVARLSLIGKDTSKISLPVDILAPESTLQRRVKTLAYAPYIFIDTSTMDPLQKLKKTIIFGLSIALLSLHLQKPFTAHLGQTFQAKMQNSCVVFGEQLSTSPQMSALLLAGKDYMISACIEPKLYVMMNSIRAQNKGVYSVRFADQSAVDFILPSRELSGLCFDQRTFKLLGKSYYWMEKQRLFLQLNFQINGQFTGPSCKTDYFEGMICEVSPEFMREFISSKTIPTSKDILRKIQKVSGRWTKEVYFENEIIDLQKLVISDITSEVLALQSDSTFRQDINQLKHGNVQASQKLQIQMSTQQRNDLQLRKNTTQQTSKK